MFVDIHSHIIPGIDDGAIDVDTALNMLWIASLDGIRHIAATPHFSPSATHARAGGTLDVTGDLNTADVLSKKTAELIELASVHQIDIKIYPGAEVLLHMDIPLLLGNNQISAINGSRYLLVEFPLSNIPLYTSEVLYQIQLKGYTPIISHPERYHEIIKDQRILEDLIGRGMLAQVNTGSLTGRFGRVVRKTAMKLIKLGMVHFVASDAHNDRGRAPELSKAAAIVAKKFGKDVMQRLFYENGLAVLENRRC